MSYRAPVSTAPSRKLSLRLRQQRKVKNVSENDTFILSPDPTGEKNVVGFTECRVLDGVISLVDVAGCKVETGLNIMNCAS